MPMPCDTDSNVQRRKRSYVWSALAMRAPEPAEVDVVVATFDAGDALLERELA